MAQGARGRRARGGAARARRPLRVPPLPRLRPARAAARAARAHLRGGDPAPQGRRHQGRQRRHPRDRVRGAALPDGARRARRGPAHDIDARRARGHRRARPDGASARAGPRPRLRTSCAASSTACSTTTTSRRSRCRARRSSARSSPSPWTVADWDALAAQLATHRARGAGSVQRALRGAARARARGEPRRVALRSAGARRRRGPRRRARRSGHRDAPAVARRLIEFTRARRYRALSAACRARLEQLLPLAVGALARAGGREATAARLLDLLEAIGGREAYYSLLVEQPQVLARATHLVARSAWAARLARAPPDPAGRAHAQRRELHRHRLGSRARRPSPPSARPSTATSSACSTTCATTSSARCCASPSRTSRASSR